MLTVGAEICGCRACDYAKGENQRDRLLHTFHSNIWQESATGLLSSNPDVRNVCSFCKPGQSAHDRSMTAESLSRAFAQLSTPLIADAALRLKIPFRISPPGIRPVTPNQRLTGPALPVRHFGSVDVFLEAMQGAQPGDVLVIDNGGRLDEGCIGDLTALEAENCLSLESLSGARIATHQSCGRFVCQFSATGCGRRPAAARHSRFLGIALGALREFCRRTQ
jgi:Demethylmenaquinone methyltransferase